MLRPLVLLGAALLTLPLHAQTPPLSSLDPSADTVAVSVEAAITRAVALSPDVEAERAQLDFAQARSRFARANRFLTELEATSAHAAAPGLDIPAGNTLPDDALYLNPDLRNDWDDLRPFNQVEFEAIQPVWTWGELGKSIEAARHGVDVEAAAVDKQALEVAFRTGELYYNVLLTDALLRLAEQTGDIVERAKREIDRLLQEGAPDVDDADLFQVQLTEQEYRRRVVEVTQRRLTARAALRRQLLLPDAAVIAPRDDVLEPIAFAPEPLETYFAEALAARPELEQARAGLAAREALVDVARSDYFPKLFVVVDGRYAYAAGRERQRNPYVGDSFLSRRIRAGAGVRWDLNIAQTRAEIEQAKAERQEVQHQLDGARQLVLFEVEDAYRNLLTQLAALEAQTEALTISREWLRLEQINFDLDLGDTENLVDAVRAQLEQEARYYEAVRNYNTAVLRLLRATGTLTLRAQSGTLVD